MRAVNAVLAVIFAAFAFLQFNDPDPYLWVPAYAYIAMISALAIFGQYSRPLILASLVSYQVFLVFHFATFYNQVFANAGGEEGREFFGLLLCAVVLIYHYLSSARVVSRGT